MSTLDGPSQRNDGHGFPFFWRVHSGSDAFYRGHGPTPLSEVLCN